MKTEGSVILFSCSKCSKSIRVDHKCAGRQGKCPKCGNVVKVPDHSTIIEFSCEKCSHRIRVAEQHAGMQGKCPHCKHPVVVPAPQQPIAQEEGEAHIVTCSMCAETIPMPHGVAEEAIACPGCGCMIDALSGSPVSEYDESEDDLYGEPAEPETSSGPDHRLVMIIAGVTAVVLVGIVGLVFFLRTSDSDYSPEPIAPYLPQETAEAEADTKTPSPPPAIRLDSTPETVDADAPDESGNGLLLQFSPSPGYKRRMRVSVVLDISSEFEGRPPSEGITTQSVTFVLEVGETRLDGAISIRTTIAHIQIKTEMGNYCDIYDSAETAQTNNSVARLYSPFIDKAFTIIVSGQGEIVDSNLDELFLAVAEKRMQAEDDRIRESLGERADAEIEQANQRFGSRQERALNLKKQYEESFVFGKEEILYLVGELVVSLPTQGIQSGTQWNAPLGVRVGTSIDMPAAYKVTAIDESICVITARGERGEDEEPFVYQVGNTSVSNELAGPSQLTMTIDRQTGWLRHKEQKTQFSGRMIRNSNGISNQTSLDVMEITTTVELVD